MAIGRPKRLLCLPITEADVGRPPHDSGHVGGHLAAGVVDLHPYRTATGLTRLRPFGKGLQGRVRVEHDTGGGGQRLGVDHHIAGDQQTGTAGGPAPVQGEYPLVGKLAVTGHVLLHGRFGDPIPQHLTGAKKQW
jgi:hypothetical protein